MSASEPRTLDVPESQVLIDCFDDPNQLRWHHRLLLLPTPVAGVWIGSTPDFSVQRIDLNEHRVVSLPRNGAFPTSLVDQIYSFESPIAEADLRMIRGQASDLSRVLGVVGGPTPPVLGGAWRVADPSADSFGDEVPTILVGDRDQFVAAPTRGSGKYESALVLIDDAWTYCQLVDPGDFPSLRRGLVSHHGRDRRVVGDDREASTGCRFLCLSEALSRYTEEKEPPFPLGRQRVTFELLRALRASGMEWMSHHLDFIHKSGLSPMSGTCRTHRRLTEALQCFQQNDLVNLPALGGIEILCRYLSQIETAVSRNPCCPDFQDLDSVVASTVNEYGGLVLPEFNRFIAQAQRDEAFTLKQMRQWREEQLVLGGGRGRSSDGAPDDGGRGRGRGKGRKGGKDGGRGSAAAEAP